MNVSTSTFATVLALLTGCMTADEADTGAFTEVEDKARSTGPEAPNLRLTQGDIVRWNLVTGACGYEIEGLDESGNPTGSPAYYSQAYYSNYRREAGSFNIYNIAGLRVRSVFASSTGCPTTVESIGAGTEDDMSAFVLSEFDQVMK